MSFQASIFTDVVPSDGIPGSLLQLHGVLLTRLILQTPALTNLGRLIGSSGWTSITFLRVQEPPPLSTHKAELLDTYVLVWLSDLVPACSYTPAPIAGTLNQSPLLLGKGKDKNKLWLKLLFSGESCEDLPSPFFFYRKISITSLRQMECAIFTKFLWEVSAEKQCQLAA